MSFPEGMAVPKISHTRGYIPIRVNTHWKFKASVSQEELGICLPRFECDLEKSHASEITNNAIEMTKWERKRI